MTPQLRKAIEDYGNSRVMRAAEQLELAGIKDTQHRSEEFWKGWNSAVKFLVNLTLSQPDAPAHDDYPAGIPPAPASRADQAPTAGSCSQAPSTPA